MLVKLLLVLETFENPSVLALYKLAVFISFHGKNPSPFHKRFWVGAYSYLRDHRHSCQPKTCARSSWLPKTGGDTVAVPVV